MSPKYKRNGNRFEALHFLFSEGSRTNSGLIQHPIQWIMGDYFLPRVNRWGREADHSLPSCAEANVVLNLHSPIRVNGVVLN
jgi:hypothetical protein